MHVLCQLHRFEAGRQKLHKHGTLSVVNAGSLEKAETILQTGTDYRDRASCTIIDFRSPASRKLNTGGGYTVNFLHSFITDNPFDYLADI